MKGPVTNCELLHLFCTSVVASEAVSERSEINPRGRIASYHFSPTPLSRQNLLDEGIKEEAITVTGNTVIDALYMVVDKIKHDKSLDIQLEVSLKKAGYNVKRLNEDRSLVLITGHRRENFGNGFIHMCQAIKTLTEKYPQVDFVYPMHLNPNVRQPIYEVFGAARLSNMFFIEPLEYLSFIYLMEKSTIVLTDSGGIQEEAPRKRSTISINTFRPDSELILLHRSTIIRRSI